MASRIGSRFRLLSLGGAAVCVGALLFAYLWLERSLGLEPCPLCMFDRFVIGAAAIVLALAALHNPAGRAARCGYAAVSLLILLVGVAIGSRHVWLQTLPEDEVPSCGPSLDYMFDVFPFTEALAMVIQGSGSCAEIDAAFLGVSLAQWTLVLFVGLAGLVGWLLWRP